MLCPRSIKRFEKSIGFIKTGIFVVAMLLVVQVCFAHAGKNHWHFKQLEKENLDPAFGYYRKTQFSHPQHVFIAHCVVLKHANRFKGAVIDQPDGSLDQHPTIIQISQQHQAVVAVNGGYFLPNFSPAGLFIFAGKKISPLSKQASLSGVLSISRRGKIRVLKRNAPLKHSYFAIQAGPFLIDPGGKMGIKSQGAVNRRTIVGVTKSKKTFLINTSPVSLYDLAYLLKYKPTAFGLSVVDRALNLDGGPSSAMYVKLANSNNVTIKEKLAVRNFIIVTDNKSSLNKK